LEFKIITPSFDVLRESTKISLTGLTGKVLQMRCPVLEDHINQLGTNKKNKIGSNNNVGDSI
jgi:ribosomal protein S28E/S33